MLNVLLLLIWVAGVNGYMAMWVSCYVGRWINEWREQLMDGRREKDGWMRAHGNICNDMHVVLPC